MRKELFGIGLPILISVLLVMGKYEGWFGSILYPSSIFIFITIIVSFYLLLDGVVKKKSGNKSIWQKISHILLLLAIPIHILCMYGIYYYATHNQYIITNETEVTIELDNLIGCERKNLDRQLLPGKSLKMNVEAAEECRNLVTYTKGDEKKNLILPTPKPNSMNRVAQIIR